MQSKVVKKPAGRLVSVAFAVGLAAGCGGGGGGGSDSPALPDPPPTAQPPPTPDPPTSTAPELTSGERFSGGAAGTSASNEQAFSKAPPAIEADFTDDANFKSGNAIFRNDHEGQGPVLNAATCQGCHVRDGRGIVPPNQQTPFDSMFLRLSVGSDADGNPIPDPSYGTQLQTFGAASFNGNDITVGLSSFGGGTTEAIGEAFAFIEYEEVPGAYPDGETYSLRMPTYKVRELSYGDFVDGIQFSPRVAQQMIGLGLLGAIPEADIRALADPDDADSDGISGRVNESFDPTTESLELGRYGYKATSASVLQQTAGAYRGDMGVTSRFATEEPCAANQASCIAAAMLEPDPHPGAVDISDLELALVEFYGRLLAVPDRRGYNADTDTWDADIVAGREHFFDAGCGACHAHSFETSTAAGSVLGEISLSTLTPDAPPIDVLSNQTIFPYTDLLLHDMGGSCQPVAREDADGNVCNAGDNCIYVLRCEGLADGRPDRLASGTEWRTAPLWGLGLVQTVSPAATFLHDGRARTIEEAVLWHGGEAQTARDAFSNLPAAERARMLAFLESL
ncbi:MAG: di-heme oxidoredictase family protein [Pseudomonadota bacterium]